MDNNSQTLEMQIKAKSEEALQSLDKLINKLIKVESSISNVQKKTNDVSTDNSTKQVDKLTDSIERASKSMSKLKSAFSFIAVKKIVSTGLQWMDYAVDYTEQLNLFNVVLDESVGKATKFQNKMAEAFGTNKTETLKMQALYQSMAENMGMPSNYAYIMSENTTKLVNDISSLYNKSESVVSEALRAGVFAG